MSDIAIVLKAMEFAAGRHRKQFRKGEDRSPYINHPIQVASLLANEAGEEDTVLIAGAVLHDVIEDTVETGEEKEKLIDQLRNIFGQEVLYLTLEVTDDRSLDKKERKRLQIVHAPDLSVRAKKLKIADKIMNVRDITSNPPQWWTLKRIQDYLEWAEKVVSGLRGVNRKLDGIFDEALKAAKQKYN